MVEFSPVATTCPRCGHNAVMRPVGDPTIVAHDAELEDGRRASLYANLQYCPERECTGAIVAYYLLGNPMQHVFHRPRHHKLKVSEAVPERPRTILQDANDAKKSPVACATTAVRAVEAMLANEGYNERAHGLKKRIETAVADGKLPQIMADWAEEVRVIGNESHTDENPPPLPDKDDAERVLLFANTLATYLFVLPDKITRARPPPGGAPSP